MKSVFFALVILFAAWLEASIVLAPLTAAVIVLTAVSNPTFSTPKILILATLGGLVLDLLLVRPLGPSSMFFLGILSIILLYKRKVNTRSPFFVTAIVFLATLFYSFIFYRHSMDSFYWAIILTILVAGILLFFRQVFTHSR